MQKRIFIRIISAILVCVMLAACLASCGSKAVISYTTNGKTYTVTEKDVAFLMSYQKLDVCCQVGITKATDYAAIWDNKFDEEQTVGEYYNDIVKTQLKTALIERALFEEYGLELDSDTVASYKTNIKTSVKSYGGKGYFKQYWGYTPDQLLDYTMSADRSKAVFDYLYGDEGKYKLSDEDYETYYNENYVGYQLIVLDMLNGVSRNEFGDRIVSTTTDELGNVTDEEKYVTYALTDEEVEEKNLLPDLIMNRLKEGEDFGKLMAEYSDYYYSEKYPDGVFVLKSSNVVNEEAVINALKELEIGENTEPIKTGNGETTYIVKRIALRDKVYDEEAYSDMFSSYRENISYVRYDELLKEYEKSLVIDEELFAKYSVATAFLSEYADYYYQQSQSES